MNTTPTPDPTAALTAGLAAYGAIVGIVSIAFLLLTLIINWRIVSKAGYSGVLSLLALVPLVNFIVILIFAFAEWPVEKRAKAAALGVGLGIGGPPTVI